MPTPPASTPDTLITTYLEMTSPKQFQPAFLADAQARQITLMRLGHVDVQFYKFLYTSVGEGWHWHDRLLMPEAELIRALSNPDCSIRVLYVEGNPAGYFELVKQGENTEIVYLGLRPPYVGQGLGKHLLSEAIAQAWHDGAARVWLHTCNLDAPGALENYQKRGFQVYDERVEPMPEHYA